MQSSKPVLGQPDRTTAQEGPSGCPAGSRCRDLDDEVRRLAIRTGHWGPARWSVPAEHGDGATRAELVHALVQRLADRVAKVEGTPARPVPRLANDLALLDQVRVMVADLAVAEPDGDVLAAAVTDLVQTRRAL